MNGWGVGKLDDICREMSEWDFDVFGVTETQLRERCEIENDGYRMIGKGRSNWEKRGGGVVIIIRRDLDVGMEEVKVGECEMSEDIFAVRLTYKVESKSESLLLVVCYMTVEGRDARQDNVRKYDLVRRLRYDHRQEEIMVMGDMNGHIGILGEEINGNGQLLIDFTEEDYLENLNVTMAQGRVTWSGNRSESAIDFILVNEKARRRIQYVEVDEDRMIDIQSDHNMVWLVYTHKPQEKAEEPSTRGPGWKLKTADWEHFREDLEQVTWECEGSVDEMNDLLVETLRRVAKNG